MCTDTLWLDAAIVMAVFAVGGILFGRFEEHKPRWRRLLKVAVVTGVTLGLAATVGRSWAYLFLAVPLAGAAWVHLVWLPRHGVSGWTAEPRERYLALLASRGASRGTHP
jgi:hypothetical protein